MNDARALIRFLERAPARKAKPGGAKPQQQTTTAKPAAVTPVTRQASLVNEDELKHEQHRAAVLNCFYNYYMNK